MDHPLPTQSSANFRRHLDGLPRGRIDDPLAIMADDAASTSATANTPVNIFYEGKEYSAYSEIVRDMDAYQEAHSIVLLKSRSRKLEREVSRRATRGEVCNKELIYSGWNYGTQLLQSLKNFKSTF